MERSKGGAVSYEAVITSEVDDRGIPEELAEELKEMSEDVFLILLVGPDKNLRRDAAEVRLDRYYGAKDQGEIDNLCAEAERFEEAFLKALFLVYREGAYLGGFGNMFLNLMVHGKELARLYGAMLDDAGRALEAGKSEVDGIVEGSNGDVNEVLEEEKVVFDSADFDLFLKYPDLMELKRKFRKRFPETLEGNNRFYEEWDRIMEVRGQFLKQLDAMFLAEENERLGLAVKMVAGMEGVDRRSYTWKLLGAFYKFDKTLRARLRSSQAKKERGNEDLTESVEVAEEEELVVPERLLEGLKKLDYNSFHILKEGPAEGKMRNMAAELKNGVGASIDEMLKKAGELEGVFVELLRFLSAYEDASQGEKVEVSSKLGEKVNNFFPYYKLFDRAIRLYRDLIDAEVVEDGSDEELEEIEEDNIEVPEDLIEGFSEIPSKVVDLLVYGADTSSRKDEAMSKMDFNSEKARELYEESLKYNDVFLRGLRFLAGVEDERERHEMAIKLFSRNSRMRNIYWSYGQAMSNYSRFLMGRIEMNFAADPFQVERPKVAVNNDSQETNERISPVAGSELRLKKGEPNAKDYIDYLMENLMDLDLTALNGGNGRRKGKKRKGGEVAHVAQQRKAFLEGLREVHPGFSQMRGGIEDIAANLVESVLTSINSAVGAYHERPADLEPEIASLLDKLEKLFGQIRNGRFI